MFNRYVNTIYKSKSMNKYFESEFWIGGAYGVFSAIASFIVPLWPILLFILCAIFVDLRLGIRAARVRQETINSKGIRRTVDKFFDYSSTILVLHGLSLVFLPSVNFAYFGAFAIALAEVKSITENLQIITGVNVYDYIKSNLNSIKEFKNPKK